MRMRKIAWRKTSSNLWKGRVDGELWFFIRETSSTLVLKKYVIWSICVAVFGDQKSFDTLDECKKEAVSRMETFSKRVIVGEPG